MGWSKNGVDKMAQLQIFKKNGGKVYDLVMAQKRREQKAQTQALQDELIRDLRSSKQRCDNVWNNNITVVQKGHKTSLYSGLRKIMGI